MRPEAAQFDTHFRLPSSPLPLLLSCWVPCDLARQWLTAGWSPLASAFPVRQLPRPRVRHRCLRRAVVGPRIILRRNWNHRNES